MKWLNVITLLLVVVGGLNWGLVALGGYDLDIVAGLLGGGDERAPLAVVVYALVGLSALYQLLPLVRSLGAGGEVRAQARH
jgi:uncharacterized membrane protein YuzA (DUF378 family)